MNLVAVIICLVLALFYGGNIYIHWQLSNSKNFVSWSIKTNFFDYYYFVYLILLLLGLFNSIIIILLLFDIFLKVAQAAQLSKAMIKSAKKLLVIFGIMVYINYVFTIVVYILYYTSFEPMCNSMEICFSYIFDIQYKQDGGFVSARGDAG